jgi:hypothetical protein
LMTAPERDPALEAPSGGREMTLSSILLLGIIIPRRRRGRLR